MGRRHPFSFVRSGAFPPGEIAFDHPRLAAAEKAFFLILVGWRFRDRGALEKNQEMVRRIFTPRERYRRMVDEQVHPFRDACDCLVGVHLRRGDYATFRNGKYAYADDVYRRVMGGLAEQLPGRVGFLLASDEPVSPSLYSGFNVLLCAGHELLDLYSLACCDYIVGPPSTYSMWASFYGDVPLCHIETPDAAIRLESFSRILASRGQSAASNGGAK